MTPETAQSPSDTPTCAELRRKADDLLNRYGTVMDGAASGRAGADQARREALLTAALRELRAQLAAAAISEAYVREVEADAEARGFERGRGRAPRQRPGRHSAAAASRWQQGVLNVVRVLVPVAAGAWGALRMLPKRAAGHPFIAAAAAHKAIAGAAAVSLGGAVVLTAAVLPVSPAAPHAGTYAGPSVPAPAASVVAATPILSGPPGAPVAAHAAGVDARRAGQLGVVLLAPSAPPSSAAPAVGPTPTPLAGQLAVSSATADLSPGQQVTITLYANGGPVNWHAWCDGPDVLLSAGSGTSAPGLPSLLMFSAAPDQDGGATARCHIWPGPFEISVILPPLPSPSATATPSDTPSPDPSSS